MSILERALATLAVFMFVLGVAVRLAPLTSEQRLIASVTEDGYLMLTVARNISLGRSLTIAEGTIPTNGVQPLVAFAWAGVHRLYGGDRLPALRTIVVLQLLVALLTAACVGLLAREMFRAQETGAAAALFAASLWFASPLTFRHTTNGLETGPYVCALAALLLLDFRWTGRTAVRAMTIGALLGLLFLIRNDAVFFILVFVAAEVYFATDRRAGEAGSGTFGRRLRDAALMSAVALAVAAPWLAYNARVFGHIVPISGRAQNLNAQFAENLPALPRVLAEYGWMATSLPWRLGAGWGGALACAVVLAGVVAATARRGRACGLIPPRWAVLLLVSSALLAVYYGLVFGAAYFLSRYLFPLSLVGALVPTIWLMAGAGGKGMRSQSIGLRVAGSVAAVLLVTVSAARFHARSNVQDHAQVVRWVADHLTAETWVGAPQSGTLGYFHDRTINLDGKVNPQALDARRQNRLFDYVVRDTPIEYIVDWYGLARWIDRPESVREERDPLVLKRHFAVLVRDPSRNLVVLKRRDPPARNFTF
jgi:hypothetical protein